MYFITMKRILLAVTVGLLLLRGGAPTSAQDMSAEQAEYQKLGLSLTEWDQIRKAKMPISKVKELLRSGISITEYFRYPWIDFGISEGQWIDNRKHGLSDVDMRKTTPSAAPSPEESDWVLIQNFFVPGLYQWMRQEFIRASCMSGVAVGSVACFILVKNTDGTPYNPLFLALLGADMIWSAIDLGIQRHNERNPDAGRFTMGTPSSGPIGFAINYTF